MRQKTALAAVITFASIVLSAPTLDHPLSVQMSGKVGAKRTSYFVDPSILDLSLILPLPP